MKFKNFIRIVSGFCATIMVMSSFVTSVGATDTSEAEVAFSLKYLDSLPKEGEDNFDKFLKLPDIDKMDEKRVAVVKHKDRPDENIPVPEQTVYQQICNEVKNIEDLVDGKKPGYIAIDNSENMSRKMKIAGEIYKWVANNIKYDYESIEKDSNGNSSFRKPQDALFVYRQRIGVCAGKAELTALMMKMAKIPSVYIHTTDDADGISHAYNTIYLEEHDYSRQGWTLLDSTWGAPTSDENLREKIKLHKGMFIAIKSVIKGKLKKLHGSQDDYAEKISNILCSYGKIPKEISNDEILKINKETQEKLNELNKNEINGVKIEKIGFCRSQSGTICVEYETSLSQEEAETIYNKNNINDNLIKMKKYFPSFYNSKLDFQSANKNIVQRTVHKIHSIYNYSKFDKCDYYNCPYEHEFKVDGIKYELLGKEGNSYIKLSGDKNKWATQVKMPSDIANLGIKIEIGSGIESIDLEGDTTVDLSSIRQIRFIDIKADNSNKYIAKNGILYDKKTNKVLLVFDSLRSTDDGIEYMIEFDSGRNNVTQIDFGDFLDENSVEDSAEISKKKHSGVRLPKFLTQFNVPIFIGGENIDSVILEDDEIVDLSEAFGLKSIDITASKRYEKRNDKFFDKVLNKEQKIHAAIKIIDNKSKI